MPRVVEKNHSEEFTSVSALIGYVSKVARRINNSKTIVKLVGKRHRANGPSIVS